MVQISNTGTTLLNSLFVAFNSFMAFIPTLLGALIVLAVGWAVSGIIGRLSEKGLQRLGFERAAAKAGVHNVIARMELEVTTSHLVGLLLTWMVRLIFIQAAANLLGMPQVSGVISSIVLFIPKIALALFIVIAGSLLGGVLGKMVHGSLSDSKVSNPDLLATLTRYAVMGFATVAALSQLEIAPTIVNSLFIALIGSVALAAGLAFGLGGRGVAGELTRAWFDKRSKLIIKDSDNETPTTLRDASHSIRRTGT